MGRYAEVRGRELKLSGSLAQATAFIIGNRLASLSYVALERSEVEDIIKVLAYMDLRQVWDLKSGRTIYQMEEVSDLDRHWLESHLYGALSDALSLRDWLHLGEDFIVFA